ncbi:dTDP-glucose 4,6-dehydratase [Candidatus Poribacteria bacterium]|nr:dTDP-glucose 4,6-dehydratase [Candidatus Poribacteria bacterium]
MKILVTGGPPPPGSECIRECVKRGYDTVVIDSLSYAGDLARIEKVSKAIKIYKTDIANKEFIEHIFKTEKPESVIHWAAESHVDRSIENIQPFLDANVVGTSVLLDSAKKYKINKFINISTDEVYGDLKEDGQFFETTSLNPSSPYSVSKASADMLGRAYQRTYGVPVITVRPSNNYGPWQYPEKLIPVVIMKAMNNQKVPVYAKGENIREWLYVSDCVDGVLTILDKGKIGEIYNLGSGQEKRNMDVVKFILKLLNKSEDLIEFVKDRLGHDFRYSLNSNKFNHEFSWNAKINFEEGIEKTVKWYGENIEWVKTKITWE